MPCKRRLTREATLIKGSRFNLLPDSQVETKAGELGSDEIGGIEPDVSKETSNEGKAAVDETESDKIIIVKRGLGGNLQGARKDVSLGPQAQSSRRGPIMK